MSFTNIHEHSHNNGHTNDSHQTVSGAITISPMHQHDPFNLLPMINIETLSMPVLLGNNSSIQSNTSISMATPMYTANYDYNANMDMNSTGTMYKDVATVLDSIRVQSNVCRQVNGEEDNSKRNIHNLPMMMPSMTPLIDSLRSSSNNITSKGYSIVNNNLSISREEQVASYPKSMLPKILADWKVKFLAGEIAAVPPQNYTIVDRPSGTQFRSPLWVSGVLLRKNDSKDMKWFCLASDVCVQNHKCYSTSKSNSKVIKHLVLYHGYASSRTPSSNQYGSQVCKRKTSSSDDEEDFGTNQIDYSEGNISDTRPTQRHQSIDGNMQDVSISKSSSSSCVSSNYRNLELRLVLKCVNGLESFSSIDSKESQSLYKLISPFTVFNSDRYKQLLLEIYSNITANITKEISEAKQGNAIPILCIHLSIQDVTQLLSIPSSILRLQVSFLNSNGALKEYILGGKLLTTMTSGQQDQSSKEIRDWVKDVLAEYNTSPNDILSYTMYDDRLTASDQYKNYLHELFPSALGRISLMQTIHECLEQIFWSESEKCVSEMHSLIKSMYDVSHRVAMMIVVSFHSIGCRLCCDVRVIPFHRNRPISLTI